MLGLAKFCRTGQLISIYTPFVPRFQKKKKVVSSYLNNLISEAWQFKLHKHCEVFILNFVLQNVYCTLHYTVPTAFNKTVQPTALHCTKLYNTTLHSTLQLCNELHCIAQNCTAQHKSSVHYTAQFSFLASQPPDNPDKAWRSHFSSQFPGLPPLHSAAPGNIFTILQLYNSIVLAF